MLHDLIPYYSKNGLYTTFVIFTRFWRVVHDFNVLNDLYVSKRKYYLWHMTHLELLYSLKNGVSVLYEHITPDTLVYEYFGKRPLVYFTSTIICRSFSVFFLILLNLFDFCCFLFCADLFPTSDLVSMV